jgi:pimeloyl-ACP methyl ester carboxylesterase
MPISKERKTACYRMLLDGAPHLKVISIPPARHFVMPDQPQKFLDVLNGFLASLPAARTTR